MNVRMMRIQTVRCLALASVTLVGLALAGCQRPAPKASAKPQKQAKPAAKVVVGSVSVQQLRQTVSLPATIESDETAQLMARVEAYVAEVLVDIGDEVAAGQTLVRLAAPELEESVTEWRAMLEHLQASEQVLLAELHAARSQLDVTRAQLQLKESERDRRAALVEQGAIARQLLEETAAEVQSAEATLAKYENAVAVVEAKLVQGEAELAVGVAKLKQAEAMAGYLDIKAPFGGVVARRDIDPGNLVRPSSQSSSMKPLLVVSKIDKLRAVVHATTDVAGMLEVGQQVQFVADDLPDKVFEGTLSRTAGTYHEKTRMMQAEIDLDNSPDPGTGREEPGGVSGITGQRVRDATGQAGATHTRNLGKRGPGIRAAENADIGEEERNRKIDRDDDRGAAGGDARDVAIDGKPASAVQVAPSSVVRIRPSRPPPMPEKELTKPKPATSVRGSVPSVGSSPRAPIEFDVKASVCWVQVGLAAVALAVRQIPPLTAPAQTISAFVGCGTTTSTAPVTSLALVRFSTWPPVIGPGPSFM